MRKSLLVVLAVLLVAAFASAGAASRKAGIQMVYQTDGDGNYRLYLFGSDRSLVCEEKAPVIVQEGDAVNPMVIECKHGKASR